MIPKHLTALKKDAVPLETLDGKQIDVWELDLPADNSFLSNWAVSFRQNYCADHEIDTLRSGTGLSRAEYLTQLVFPDQKIAPGPSIRSGDFAELLVTDYVEHVLGYWVARGKYKQKAAPNESVKGADIFGFKQIDLGTPSVGDTLIVFESKAKCTGSYSDQLQEAIKHSSKDNLRIAITLNATKQRLTLANEHANALRVERFQYLPDRPYIYRSGAAAILSDAAYDAAEIVAKTATSGHQNAANLELIVIRGKELMKLVHVLYERAANEA